MPIQLSQLSNVTTNAGAIGLLLAVPQKQTGYQPQVDATDLSAVLNLISPPGFMFHYEGEQTVTFESDITDHYVEDNTARQDHISLKPIKVTTHGFIGELNDVPPRALALLKTAADKLSPIGPWAPKLSVTAQLVYAQALQLYQTANVLKNAAVSALAALTGGQSQNLQQQAFNNFYGYYQQRTLFTIQTPWALFPDMAIVSCRAIQDAETNSITDFELNFKQIRQATTVAGIIPAVLSGRGGEQNSSLVNAGTSTASPADTTQPEQLTKMGAP